MKFKHILIALLVSTGFLACEDDLCNVDTESYVTLDITSVDADYLVGLAVYSAVWTDSAYYDSKTDFDIILSPNENTTELIFTSPGQTQKDTIKIFHQNKIRLLSEQCGFVVDYKIDSIKNTNYILDSLTYSAKEITNEEKGNIKIYF